jgi:hypothetical protein
MKIKILSLLGISALLMFAACSKDDDDSKGGSTTSTTGGVSNSAVVGTWNITAMTVTVDMGGQDTTIDMLEDQEPCERDDLLKFNADNTILELAGATKCNPGDPDSEAGGTWALLSNNSKFRIIDGDTTLADIVSISATTFKLRFNEDDGSGGTSQINITLTKQ